MLRPSGEAELAEAVAGAAGHLRIDGGGTRPIGRPVQAAALSLAGLSGISLYEPGSLTMVVQAGTPLVQIEAALAAEGQRLAFEPMDHRALLGTTGEPTIGAVAAMNNAGPRRIQAGAARDYILGVRFVDGRGTVVKNGGRVMKNVTGYDLVKLLAGSWGTLGVLTEVAFKVLPVPETQATLRVQVRDVGKAVGAMAAALGSPFEVTGAAFGPGDLTRGGPVHLRLEGFAASVTYRATRLRDVLTPFGAIDVVDDPDASAAIWRDIRDVAAFAVAPMVVRLSIKPSDLVALVQTLPPCPMLADWGGGLVWAATDAAGLDDLRRFAATHGGHATLVKAPEAVRRAVPSFQPEPAALAAIGAGLRAKFDPRGILNPGLMT